MWERFYNFLEHLDRTIKMHPNYNHFTIEMEQDLFNFTKKIGFMPENGIFKFNGASFTLG
jgi:hypothetical protein